MSEYNKIKTTIKNTILVLKPAKYDDAETKKPGSTVETPFKFSDPRSQHLLIEEAESVVVEIEESK